MKDVLGIEIRRLETTLIFLKAAEESKPNDPCGKTKPESKPRPNNTAPIYKIRNYGTVNTCEFFLHRRTVYRSMQFGKFLDCLRKRTEQKKRYAKVTTEEIWRDLICGGSTMRERRYRLRYHFFCVIDKALAFSTSTVELSKVSNTVRVKVLRLKKLGYSGQLNTSSLIL